MGATIHNVENDRIYDDFVMEVDCQSYLSNFLTKQMCKILIILYFQTLSNKALAKQMGISASALSNILQRIKFCTLEVFRAFKISPVVSLGLSYIEQASNMH